MLFFQKKKKASFFFHFKTRIFAFPDYLNKKILLLDHSKKFNFFSKKKTTLFRSFISEIYRRLNPTNLTNKINIKKISTLNPYFQYFLNLYIHVHLENLQDKLIHNVCIQHNLLYEELRPFVQLYNHPKVPSLKHLTGTHVHIVYNQYKCVSQVRKFISFFSQICYLININSDFFFEPFFFLEFFQIFSKVAIDIF